MYVCTRIAVLHIRLQVTGRMREVRERISLAFPSRSAQAQYMPSAASNFANPRILVYQVTPSNGRVSVGRPVRVGCIMFMHSNTLISVFECNKKNLTC
jgi:hypothetical protein